MLLMTWDRLEVSGTEGIGIVRKGLNGFCLKGGSHAQVLSFEGPMEG